jgi:hypothetical protein
MQSTTPAAVQNTAPSASQVYEAMRAQRDVLGDQMRALDNTRNDLRRELSKSQGTVDRQGIEKRISEIDGRISEMEKQISASDASVSKAAGVPGAIVERPEPVRRGPPEEAWVLGGMFIVFVMMPMSVAWAIRMLRRSKVPAAPSLTAVEQRLTAIEQGVESIAIEVERIGEGQRFVAQLIGERTDRQRALEAENIRADSSRR